MRTKLFTAFLIVIGVALTSSLIFEWLVMKDFDAYIRGTEEDHRYWLLASVEGSYENDKWNMKSLSETLHWGMMLGFDLKVETQDGKELMNSMDIMNSLSPVMKQSMESVIHIHSSAGKYERYKINSKGRGIGSLYMRQLKKEGLLKLREDTFRQRGKQFLIVLFLIAGTGSGVLAIFFSLYLSRPIKKLRYAAERLADGDFNTRTETSDAGKHLPKVSYKDELKSLTDSFNYMAEALQKAEVLRQHLSSNIAHELRTPLAVMKAQSEAMLDGLVEDKQAGLRNIKEEIEKLILLVEGLEDMAKAEASFFTESEYRALNLKEFLRGIEYSMEPLFRKKKLTFSLVDTGGLEVVSDADKLERIMNNLLSNALKYTDNGGVWVEYGTDKSGFFVEVRDTGRGIPENEIPKVFTRFYRCSDNVDVGIGLGLAIAKELVDTMNGRIEVKSALGAGTAFRIWLPARFEA